MNIFWRFPMIQKIEYLIYKKKKTYLELKNLIMCEYTYKISSDLGEDFNRNALFEGLMA
jgi:hypothetical protein